MTPFRVCPSVHEPNTISTLANGVLGLKAHHLQPGCAACQIRRKRYYLRTDAIILSAYKKKMQLAKQGLVNVTRESLGKPKAWFSSVPP